MEQFLKGNHYIKVDRRKFTIDIDIDKDDCHMLKLALLSKENSYRTTPPKLKRQFAIDTKEKDVWEAIVQTAYTTAELGLIQMEDVLLYKNHEMYEEIREAVRRATKHCINAYDKMAELNVVPICKRPAKYSMVMKKLEGLRANIYSEIGSRTKVFTKEDMKEYFKINDSYRKCLKVNDESKEPSPCYYRPKQSDFTFNMDKELPDSLPCDEEDTPLMRERMSKQP